MYKKKNNWKERTTYATNVLVKYRNVKAMVSDSQAVKCNRVYGEGMQHGIKSEGWVLTDGASWKHDNGGVDTQKKQIKTQTHKHKTTQKEQNIIK